MIIGLLSSAIANIITDGTGGAGLITTAVVSILSASGVVALVQLLLVKRTGRKLDAESESIITGSAEKVVAMLREELDKTRSSAEASERIAGEALWIVRDLLDLTRRVVADGPDQGQIVQLETRVRELERDRRAAWNRRRSEGA